MGVVLLVWGAVTLALYQQQHTKEGEAAATYQAQSARGEIQAMCVQQPRSRSYTCTANVPVADEHDSYAEYDLRAQQDMARWAYAMAIIAFGSLLLTATGVVLLWWTLEATREAVTETAKATKAADDANAASREAVAEAKRANEQAIALFALEARPWVTLEAHLASGVRITPSGEMRITVVLVAENIGSTPAVFVEIHSELRALGPSVDMAQAQRAYCADQGKTISPLARTLFPRQRYGMSIDHAISKADLVAAASSVRKDAPPESKTFVMPFLIATVTYRSTLDQIAHQTPIMLNLRRTDPEQPGAAFVFFYEDGDVPQDLVKMDSTIQGMPPI